MTSLIMLMPGKCYKTRKYPVLRLFEEEAKASKGGLFDKTKYR